MSYSFLDQEPPPGYVAGVGRGAVGFTTRADTRTSKIDPEFVPQDDDDNEENDYLYGSNNHDDALVAGMNGSVLDLAKNQTEDDLEADRIYEQIESRMKANKKEETVEVTTRTLKFSDLKRELGTVTAEEWSNIPEVGDLTRRNKRIRLLEQQQQRTYAAPDSLIAGAMSSLTTNFKSISNSRDKLLTKQLDALLPSTASSEDQAQLLLEVNEEVNPIEVANVSKARLILQSLRKTEPHKASSWIASARLEELAKNLSQATSLISEGCRMAPRVEDVWLESIRLHLLTSDGFRLCRAIASEGLKLNSKSEALWLKAYELEKLPVSKRRVLMKGLESLPSNVRLWENLIALEEEPQDVKKLLSKAVELCPNHWEFWLALINLLEYTQAKKVLNNARKALIGYYQVWITAAKLEERENPSADQTKILKMMEKGFASIDVDSMPSRSEWLDQASIAEEEGFDKTCRAIVMNSAKLADDSNRLKSLLADANKYSNTKSNLTTNYIYEFITENYPHSVDSWIQVFDSLKRSGDNARLFHSYQKAIELNPDTVVLALMYAKDKWILDNNVSDARNILAKSCDLHSEDEELWFARVKLEVRTGNYENSISISKKSLLNCNSARVWYKHVHLLRCVNWLKPNLVAKDEIISDVDKALSKYPDCYKLYLEKIQLLMENKCAKEAREVAAVGTKACSISEDLWITLAEIDEKYLNVTIRARSVLDTAIIEIPKSDKLWEAKIMLERRNNDLVSARQIANKAMKLFPESPLIRIQFLSLIPKMSQRKNALVEALKATNNSSAILLGIGVLFWIDGKPSKAKSWFERSLISDNLNGDCWAWLYCYHKSHSTDVEIKGFIADFEQKFEDINRGDIWNKVNKSVENFTKQPTEILELVSDEILKSIV